MRALLMREGLMPKKGDSGHREEGRARGAFKRPHGRDRGECLSRGQMKPNFHRSGRTHMPRKSRRVDVCYGIVVQRAERLSWRGGT